MATYATATYDVSTYDSTSAVYTAGTPYTDTPLPHVRVCWRPEQFTRITNPGFETNTTGWAVTAGINAAGTSITRITTDHQTGSACGQLVTTATDGSGVNFDLGSDRYFVAATYGTAYVAVVWLKRVSGATKAKLILGSLGTSSDRAELDIDLRDKWTPYRVVWMPSASRTDAELAITNGYAAALTVRIDNVSLYQLDAFSQVENGNFITGVTRWDTAGAGIAGVPSSLSTAVDGMDPSNQTCGELVTTTTNGSGTSYLLGTRLFTSGRTYRMRLAARSISGSTSLRLRLGSIGTAADRGDSTVTLTTDWQFFSVDWTPSSDRTDVAAALSNASGVALDCRFGFVEVYEAYDDISSPYLMSAEWQTGSETQDVRTPPGTITVTLNDSSKRFFPMYSSSPLYGSIAAGKRIWGRATYQGDIFPLFFGTIDKIQPDGDQLTTVITAKDPMNDIAAVDYEAGFLASTTYASVRALALGSIPSSRINVTSKSIEGSGFFSGNESQKALTVLEAMNEATGTLHFVKPHTMAEVLWQYTTIDRATLTDASVSAETINDDFADLGGIHASSDGLENHQFVPWQSYERDTAPVYPAAVDGFGPLLQALDLRWGASLTDSGLDPYLHFRDAAYGTDDNIPDPTFERITRFTKKGRKKVRKVQIYPGAFVPFSMTAGDVRTFTFDFAIPVSGTFIVFDGPTGATNISETIVQDYPRHIVVQLFAKNDDTIDFFAVEGTPWFPLDEQYADVSRYDSIASLGQFEGPSIQSPYIGSAGMAEGIAAYRNWRYGVTRIHPTLRVENRFANGVSRALGDHVTVTSQRWGLTSLVMTVVGAHGSFDQGSRFWAVTYNLEETPTGGPWFTLGNASLGLGSSAVLAH